MPDKYEREIDEILRRMTPPSERVNRRPRPPTNRSSIPWSGWLSGWTPSRLFTTGIALAFVGYFLRAIFPELAGPVTLIALACLIGGFITAFSQSRSTPRPSWRGRYVESTSPASELWAEVERRWRRWRQGRRR